MAHDFLCILEHADGALKKISGEVLTLASELRRASGHGVIAGLLGRDLQGPVQEARTFGPDVIMTCDDLALAQYSAESYAAQVVKMAEVSGASAILFGASASFGRDLSPRVAAKLGSGIAADCTAVIWDGEGLTATRPCYAGKVIAEVKLNPAKPMVVSLRPNAYPAQTVDGASPRVEVCPLAEGAASVKGKVVEVRAGVGGKLELTEAEIIVSGGRGLKAPENFAVVEALAEVLGAAVGASRAAVDAGWKPHPFQVGQTGKVVSPNVYIACGISGAIQHLAGMSSSKHIVAINKDPEAPIFKVCDYGIVGDLFEVVPLLTERVRKIKQGG